MKYILPIFLLLVTCYLLLVISPSPVLAQQAACKQACDNRLQQCQNDDCRNRAPGRDHDNCINDCVQSKDRCVAGCNGTKPPSACHAVSPPALIGAVPTDNQTSATGTTMTFSWNQPEDPDPNAGGCDGKGRNYTVIWGDCPSGTTQYNAATCSTTKGQKTFPAGPARPITTTLDVTSGVHYWYVHSECNCGASADSEKMIFTTTCGSKEETAVYNQKRGLTPEMARTPQELNILEQIITNVRNFFAGLFFPPAPCDNTKLYNQSNDLIQTKVPDQIVPKSNDAKENLKGFLGEDDGHYCVDFPDQIKGTVIKDCEAYYEQANFPNCIYPITPGATPGPDGTCPLPAFSQSSSTGGNNQQPVNTACQQVCFSTLDQDQQNCESQTGAAKDNCNNSAVQKKDRCIAAC